MDSRLVTNRQTDRQTHAHAPSVKMANFALKGMNTAVTHERKHLSEIPSVENLGSSAKNLMARLFSCINIINGQ